MVKKDTNKRQENDTRRFVLTSAVPYIIKWPDKKKKKLKNEH